MIGDGVTIFLMNYCQSVQPDGRHRDQPRQRGDQPASRGERQVPGPGRPSATRPGRRGTASATPTWIVTGRPEERGIAFYVRRRRRPTHTSIFNMSGTSPLMFQGILDGPTDNVNVSGAGSQAAVGQIIGWTVGYNGNTAIEQVFDGPDDIRPISWSPEPARPTGATRRTALIEEPSRVRRACDPSPLRPRRRAISGTWMGARPRGDGQPGSRASHTRRGSSIPGPLRRLRAGGAVRAARA